jgi:predicted CXXCH cytochrome family protein
MVLSRRSVGARHWLMVFVLPLALVAGAGGVWWWNRPVVATSAARQASSGSLAGKAVRPEPRPGGYVGSEACARCHASIAEVYARHPMYRSAGRTPGPDDVEEFGGDAEFTSADGRLYRVVKEGDGIYHHEILRDKQGDVLYDEAARIAFFFGSGTRGKSYAIHRDGLLFQSPISWFTTVKKWDLSPGYGYRHVGFGRRIPEQCVECHAGRATGDANREDYFPEPVLIEAAIGCERCHGPGDKHIALHDLGTVDKVDDPIVNPAHLSADRREAVCYQCHLIGKLQILRYGRSFDDFRPGDRLDDVWSTIVAGSGVRGDRKTKSVNHVEQMRDSVCFQSSEGRLGCTSCHDPHSVPDKAEMDAFYRQRCLTCHTERACSLPAEQQAAEPANNSCAHCHMPRLSAHDVVHASQTDHRIVRRPEGDNDLLSGSESNEMVLFDVESATMPAWEIERASALAKVDLLREAAHASLTIRLRASKDAEQVEQTLQAVIQIAPDDFASWDALGVARNLRQDSARAEEAWRRMLALKPTNEQVLTSLAEMCLKKGAYRECLEYLDRLIEINPWWAPDHARRARLLLDLGRWPEAHAAAEQALHLDPTDLATRRWLINAAQNAGDMETVRQHTEVGRRMLDER